MVGDWLESSDDDWLTEPEQRYVGVIEAAMKVESGAACADVADVKANLPALVPRVPQTVDVPVDPLKRSEQLTAAWARLEPRQQVFLSMLRQHRFNVRRTCEALSLTPDSVSRTSVKSWQDQEDYYFVWRVMKATAAGEVIDRERLLLRADEIAEEALERKPILYRGLPTGFYENNPDTALRANEQLMKTQKMLGNDDAPQNQNQGPALIIQVVQRDGAIVDLVSRGVTIDLPPPDGA